MNGSRKGAAWERSLCRRLSEWWTNGERDDCFWRTSQSGGRATSRAKAGKKADLHCGDICALDEEGAPLLRVISVEAKRGYNKHTIHDLLDKPLRGKPATYTEWFAKAERDRQRAGALYWLLIHMRDRREPLVWMLQEFACRLVALDALDGCHLHACVSTGYGETVYCETLAAFLTGVKPTHILTILKEATEKATA